jgi:hypothetical protein
MVSSPTDVAELDVEAETRRLDEALEPLSKKGLVEVRWLEKATLAALLEALEAADFHISTTSAIELSTERMTRARFCSRTSVAAESA